MFARAGAIVPMYPPGVRTLFHGSPSFPDETSVGDDRVVLVCLGRSSELTEVDGLGYALEQPTESYSEPLSFRWQDESVPACGGVPVAPCVASESSAATLELLGTGELVVRTSTGDVAHLTLSGGATSRRTTLRLRY